MSETIRVLIAEDHAVVRAGLRALIDAKPGIEVVAEAANGIEAVEKTSALRPDVVLMDLQMPRKDGIAATREILAQCPDTRILVLTSFAEDDKVFPAIEAGATGYLLKEVPPAELIRAIRHVHRGEPFMDSEITRKLIAGVRGTDDEPAPAEVLTEREIEVLKLVAKGLSNQEIAARLHVSETTVGSHVSNILRKRGLTNRTEAALYALREGIASLD